MSAKNQSNGARLVWDMEHQCWLSLTKPADFTEEVMLEELAWRKKVKQRWNTPLHSIVAVPKRPLN